MLDLFETELLDEEVNHLAGDGNALDEFLVSLRDAALFEQGVGLLLSGVPQAPPVLLDACLHG